LLSRYDNDPKHVITEASRSIDYKGEVTYE
jgi:hypothetical protein